MSKGSRPRPSSVSQEELANRHNEIFGKKPPKERYVPPPLPVIEEKKVVVDWGNVKDSEQGG
jgi:hypothetical protein